MNKKNKYLIKNSIIFFISAFSTKILSFFLMPLYTSILSTKEYGIADLLLTTTTLLIYVFTLNIGDAVLRFSIEKPSKSKLYLGFGIKIAVLGSIICLFSILILFLFDFWGIGRTLYILLFFNYLLNAIFGLLLSYSQGIDRVIYVGIASTISSSITIALNVIFLTIIKLRVEGLLLSQIIGILIATLYLFIVLKIYNISFSYNNQDEENYKKKMVSFSLPLIFNGIAWWLNSAFDKYIITFMIGVNNTGVYSAASRIPMVLTSVNSIFGQAWGLSVVKDVDSDDNDGFFSKTYELYNLILVLLGSFLIFFNIPLAKILFAKNFFSAWRYSSILIISTIFNALSSFLGGAFSKSMKTNEFAKSTIISLLINILLNILLIPKYELIGAAIATSISFFALWIIRLILVKKYIRINIKLYKHIISYLILFSQILIEHLLCKFSMIHLLFITFLILINFKEIRNYISIYIFKNRQDI